MKNLFMSLFLMALVGLFLGCATLSKKECLEADWAEIGHRDGLMGRPRALYQEHVDACQKFRVSPDRPAYYEGRSVGLKSYCTKGHGFEQGKRGRKYNYVCPPELEQDFLAGYAKGKEIYKYESKITSLKKQLAQIEKDIKREEDKLLVTGLNNDQRAKIRSDIKALDIKYRDVSRELRYMEKTRPSYSQLR